MSTEISIYDESFEASEDLSAKQYYIVKLHTTADQVALSGAGGGIGVLQNDPKANQAAAVRLIGMSLLVVDGSGTAIAIGDRLKSDAGGKGVKAGTDKDLAIAIALQAAAGSADVIRALVFGPNNIGV